MTTRCTFIVWLFCACLSLGREDGEWSPAVHGLRGRLSIELSAHKGISDDALVYLELQNTTNNILPLAVKYDSVGSFRWQLRDQAGDHVRKPESSFGSIIDSGAYTLFLPRDSSLRFRVSVSGYGLKQSGLAIQLPAAFWLLERTDRRAYFLSAQFSAGSETGADPRSWSGTLHLPPVRLPTRKPHEESNPTIQ